jgi:catalase-peroxidase
MKVTGKKVSIADLIVLSGCSAVEQVAMNGGSSTKVPFTPEEQMRVKNVPILIL